MKKTLITILALGGVVLGADPSPVWTSDLLAVGTTTSSALPTGLGLNTTDGVTAMITINWTGVSNAPFFWLGTDDGSAYANSVATFGYCGNVYHSSLFSTDGSNGGITNLYNNVTAEVKTPDYISTVVNNTAKNGSLADKALTFFMTSQDGNSALYEVMDDNSIVLLCTLGNMKTGDITGYHVGHWNGQASAQTGEATVALYNKVLTPDEMKSIAAPEPATATLSLLAPAAVLMGGRTPCRYLPRCQWVAVHPADLAAVPRGGRTPCCYLLRCQGVAVHLAATCCGVNGWPYTLLLPAAVLMGGRTPCCYLLRCQWVAVHPAAIRRGANGWPYTLLLPAAVPMGGRTPCCYLLRC